MQAGIGATLAAGKSGPSTREQQLEAPGAPASPKVVDLWQAWPHDLGVADRRSRNHDGAPVAAADGDSAEPEAQDLVRLGDTTVSLTLLRRSPEQFARAYEQTKATVGYAECLCTEPAQHLVVRSRSGRFHLACWPGRRGAHAPHCHFHQVPDHLSGRSRYAAAIEEDLDGVRLHLDVSLTVNLAESGRSRVRAGGQQRSGGTRSMSLLGLLHHLWERAALNRWPGPRRGRGWRECVRQLAEAIDEVRLDQVTLTQVLHVVRPFTQDAAAANDRAFERFASQLGRRGELIRHGLLLGEIKSIEPARRGGRRLALRQTKTPVFVDEALLARLKRSYPTVFSAARPDDARQLVLLVVDRTTGGFLRLVDGAAMLTNNAYIPGDSSFEVIMADRLIEAGRAFVKPLRYDQGDDLFPDYVLVDVDPNVAVEIWGVKGREIYDVRRKDKLGIYGQSSTLSLLQWDVTDPTPTVEELSRPE
jgi:Protein of unknown function (DUF1173)